MPSRRDRRSSERQAKVDRAKQVGPGGGFFSRLSTDWIVAGIIIGVVVLAATIFTVSHVFKGRGSAPQTEINQVFSVAVSAESPQTLYLGDVTGLYRSTNGGKTWDRFNLTDPVRKVYADPNNAKTFYAASGTSVRKSADGGSTWVPLTSSLPSGDVTAFALDPLDSAKMYAFVGGNGLYKSEDGGGTWTRQNSVTSAGVTSLAVKPGSPDTIYAFHTVDGFVTSIDNGRRLDGIGQGVPKNAVTDILTFADEPEAVIAASGRGLYKSTDDGLTWKAINAGLENVQVIAVGRNPVNGNLYVADVQGIVYVSTNGGTSWSRNA